MVSTKCMKYLTFLDYTTLETTGKNIEAKLSEKEKEIQLLRQHDSVNTDAIANLSDQVIMRGINKLLFISDNLELSSCINDVIT